VRRRRSERAVKVAALFRQLTDLKRMILLPALFAVALCMTGCAEKEAAQPDAPVAQSEAAGDIVKIGVSFDSFVIERWIRDRDIFVSTAKGLGADVNVQNASGEVEEQIEQIRYLIDKQMDVIVIVAIDGTALKEVIAEAKAAGIRVVSYDRLIKDCDTDLYISFDNEKVGTLMGEALAEALPQGGTIFEILGSASDNNVTQVKKGFEDALLGTGIQIAYSSYCDNWLAELAFDAVNDGLEKTGGEVDGVMCGNDDLAGQAIKALTESKKAGSIPVVAQDADLSGCQRIVEGTQTMTVYKPVEDEAEMAARFAVALAKGEDITSAESSVSTQATISDGTYDIPCCALEPVAVTKENLDEVIIDSGFHQRDDVYLNVE